MRAVKKILLWFISLAMLLSTFSLMAKAARAAETSQIEKSTTTSLSAKARAEKAVAFFQKKPTAAQRDKFLDQQHRELQVQIKALAEQRTGDYWELIRLDETMGALLDRGCQAAQDPEDFTDSTEGRGSAAPASAERVRALLQAACP